MNKLIGVSGFATSGKDTLFTEASSFLKSSKKKACRFAFADELKNECNDFLLDNIGISAFTKSPIEKEIIRPFLVTYGTDLRRRLDPLCWIKKISSKVSKKHSEGAFVFVTDVRFLNEAQWIIDSGGFLVHVSRSGIGPANTDEHKEFLKYKNLIDLHVKWPATTEPKLYLNNFFNFLSSPKFKSCNFNFA